MILKRLLAEIDIECLIFSVGHIDLVRLNFELFVISSWRVYDGLFLATHD